ncbi:MAG: Precorrin-3B methylase [Thainema sp.]
MAKQNPDQPLEGDALIKEVCRRIRVARSYWDAHNNRACRGEREKALELYNQLTKEQKQQIPEVLKVWLHYRSEKYFGDHRTPPGTKPGAKHKNKGKRGNGKHKG